MATAAASSSIIESTAVQLRRIRVLKERIHHHPPPSSSSSNVGPVVYWMFRDQRLRDNWALIHAVDQANRLNVPVAGEATETIPSFLKECGASLLVTDFSPLRQVRGWKEEISKRVSDSVSIHEVDAHNVVPIWVASDKLEYGARTIRRKINRLLPDYLIDFPTLKPQSRKWPSTNRFIDWKMLIENVVRKGAEVPEIEWCEPGEVAALETLMGNNKGFLTTRIKNYSADRNNPLKPEGLSGLSPYLHFGQISAQRCALEACKVRKVNPQAVDAFLEELIVRRELADNFCYYQVHYDSLQGAWDWARKTLMDHASDKREHLYTKEQLEKAQTADPVNYYTFLMNILKHGFLYILTFFQLWNASQMYWAKKILEWTSSPEEALEIAINLNDKGWQERAVFGKIRYMNYAGCKRKFNVDGYIAYVKRLVGDIKKRKGQALLNNKAKQLTNIQRLHTKAN
ncbi:DNA photolyase, class 2 [Cynara cardunculus var. scolymus]|uniref:DNA photolyase, class 2 n=1 Tax=Cynara cardunculus var. scolymus TaxID=59895 RepID=A0A103XFZ7_CYNCS|nr:DNA photolyase, class 2 [Cynara cardunculus var. scolymus]